MDYQHVLLATDLSEYSSATAQRAYDISKSNAATLSMMHVVEAASAIYAGEFSPPVHFDLEEEVEKSARTQLAELASQYHVPADRQYVCNGRVRYAIIELAKQIKADLIVIGTHNYSGLEMLLGTTASAVLHHAKCDVLVVRQNSTEEEA